MPTRIYPASRRSFYFTLHYHPSLKELRAAYSSAPWPAGSARRVVAFCTRYFEEKGAGKCIGEIHLPSATTPAIIAHECTHAAIHYLRLTHQFKKLPTCDDEEPLCYAIQALVDQITSPDKV